MFRETIIREWRLVNGQLVRVLEQRVTDTPAATTSITTRTASTQAESGEAGAAATSTTTSESAAAAGDFLPDYITDDEIEAQERLFAGFQPPRPNSRPSGLLTPS